MWEAWFQSLSWEDPLEKRMAMHFGILAWRIPWTEEPDRLQSMDSQSVRHDWEPFTFTVFPIVMYGCESWSIKKAERWRTDAWEFWCWRRLLRVPWTARKSNQSILKEINFEYSLEGLMLKLKFQYFRYLMQKPTHWKRPWGWERLKAKGQGGSRGWDCLIASPTKWTWIWADFRR